MLVRSDGDSSHSKICVLEQTIRSIADKVTQMLPVSNGSILIKQKTNATSHGNGRRLGAPFKSMVEVLRVGELGKE